MLTIIEVGASHGDDTIRLSDGDRNRLFAFEPTPELFYKVHDRFLGYENFYFASMAVDLDDGWRWFNVTATEDRGASSLYDFDKIIAAKWDSRAFVHASRYRVMTTRLDTFMNLNNIETVDYLWIDAQGNDFRVLQSLGARLKDVYEGKCEAAYTDSLYSNAQNDYRITAEWLIDHGFDVAIAPIGGECDIHFRKRS